MGRLGADVDELVRLARSLESAAETLADDRRQVATAVRRTPWDGPDAERFRHDWSAAHGPSLAAVACAFEDAARTLRAEARAQRRASDGEGAFPVDPTRPRFDGRPGEPGGPHDPQEGDQRSSADDVGLGATVAGGAWGAVTSLPLDEVGGGYAGASLSAFAVGTAAVPLVGEPATGAAFAWGVGTEVDDLTSGTINLHHHGDAAPRPLLQDKALDLLGF